MSDNERTSSIDEFLFAKPTFQQPTTPEQVATIEPEESAAPRETSDASNTKTPDEYGLDESSENTESEKQKVEADEYGNEKTPPKVYTEDEVNERINAAVRERLARAERNQQPPTQQQAQQAANAGFEYNSESTETWQQQLESFVEQTVSRMSQKQAQQAIQQREQNKQAEFDDKFRSGMGKFKDFNDVVGKQAPIISDAMTMALRGVNDPAAFIYAASKREPKELERISRIEDPYAQIAEMGKLEERMKKTKPMTNAPRPVGRTQEDAPIAHNDGKKREPTIEELISQSAAKKLAVQNSRTRR